MTRQTNVAFLTERELAALCDSCRHTELDHDGFRIVRRRDGTERFLQPCGRCDCRDFVVVDDLSLPETTFVPDRPTNWMGEFR